MASPDSPSVFPLDRDSSGVEAARSAERAAYAHYGLEPAEHLVDLPELGCRLRVVEAGDGPPLVLIIGGEGTGLQWLPLLPELDDWTLYVVDRPGGGLSDGLDYRSVDLARAAASSTRAAFDELGIDAAPVLGNSMGGLWTLRFALEHPDRVTAIGLLGCPAVYPGTSAPLPMRIGSISLLSGIIVEKMMQPDQVEDVWDTMSFLGHPEATRRALPDELAEAWFRMNVLPTYKPTWIGILQSVLRLRGANPEAAFTAEDLRAIEAPVRLLWGSEDPFGSVEKGRAGASEFPEAEFHEVGIGHLPWLDEPAACGERIQEFLEPHR